MVKMKLDLNALRVDSFDTATAESARGTVQARSGEPQPGDVVLLPVTDWKTCQGGDCTARTLCHYSCLGECLGGVDPVNGAIRV
ncbi:MAG TPA: hypothetical protein VEX86_21590 [Longimicrobium sp.]|nr:hypothetical protein [Longimicrobium sp.]